MITLYSGTPGSGKSLEMAHEISRWIKFFRKNVIANTPINVNAIMGKSKKERGRFFYLDNSKFTPDFFYMYAMKYHDLDSNEFKEHQSLIVVDECQSLYHPNVMKLECQTNKNYRKEWLDFFTQHRQLGFDIILISQFDKLIDAQVRCLLEYNYVHRKANNFRTIGKVLTVLGIPLFIQVQKWYGINEVTDKKFFTYTKKYSKVYDSYAFRNKVMAYLKSRYGEKKMQEIMGFRPTKINIKSDKEIHEKEVF